MKASGQTYNPYSSDARLLKYYAEINSAKYFLFTRTIRLNNSILLVPNITGEALKNLS
jgi:hypothetical protein